MQHAGQSLNRIAISATLHCLTGCAFGEVLGLVIATALGWGDAASIALAIVLAFFSATCSRWCRSCGPDWRSARRSRWRSQRIRYGPA